MSNLVEIEPNLYEIKDDEDTVYIDMKYFSICSFVSTFQKDKYYITLGMRSIYLLQENEYLKASWKFMYEDKNEFLEVYKAIQGLYIKYRDNLSKLFREF